MDPQEFLDLARHLFPGQRELWGVSLVGRVHVGAVGGAVDEDGGGRGAGERVFNMGTEYVVVQRLDIKEYEVWRLKLCCGIT